MNILDMIKNVHQGNYKIEQCDTKEYLETQFLFANLDLTNSKDNFLKDLESILRTNTIEDAVIIGRDELINQVFPDEYIYTTPSGIGGIDLEFRLTDATIEGKKCRFISSFKLENNTIFVLCHKRRD
jgi:hypothetical protein